MSRRTVCTLLVLSFAAVAWAQTAPPVEEARALLAKPAMQAAFQHVEKERAAILEQWIRLTEVNAPSGQERARAEQVLKLLKKMKYKDAHIDQWGNVVAVRRGSGGGPAIVVDAHLDTVFQPGLKIQVEKKDGKLYAPGVGDNTRNIEAVLAMARALDAAKLRTRGDIVMLFTTEEETGLGGARQYIRANKASIGHYIALDGGYNGFTYGGIGINNYRHHFLGPGGHTRSKTPPYSATLPMARAIERIYAIPLPNVESTHINIGMLGGSDVINAKASDAWFSVDLRSTSNEVIADLERRIAAIVQEEAAREGMTARTDRLSVLPASQIPSHRDSRLVRAVEAIHLAMGFNDPPITRTGSNNGNVALLEGLSAISTGCAPCGDSHALTENCEIEPIYRGIQKLIAMTVAMAEMQ